MGPYSFDAPLSGAEELAAVLDYSGVPYEREKDTFRFRFASRGCKWQMLCSGVGCRVLMYAIHPTPIRERSTALEACCYINSQVVTGSCFPHEEHLVFRTDAELIEACAAREMILRALEYSAAVMTGFWSEMSQGAAGHFNKSVL